MTAFPHPHLSLWTTLASLGRRMPAAFTVAWRSGNSRSGSGTFRSTGRLLPRRDETPVTEASTNLPISDLTRSDEELLVAYRTGETGAFTTLVDRYRNELVHFLQRFLGSRAAADDVFQDAFLQVHLSADSFDADRRFKPWLYTIAANKARDFHRKRRRRSAVSLSAPVGSSDGRETSLVDLLSGSDESVDAGLLDQEKQGMVKEVVDDLPPHYREILLLSYFQKLSYNQIADSLQIPLGTVKSRLHAAVAHFADSWRAASERETRRKDRD